MGTLNRRAFLARQAMVWTGLLWLPKAAGQLVTTRGVPRKPAAGAANPYTNPKDITGVWAFWWAPDIVGLNSGDQITTWQDSSAVDNDLTGVGTTKPKYYTGIQNGKAIVRFDGSTGCFSEASTNWSSYSEATAVVCLKVNATTGAQMIVEYTANLNADRPGFFFYVDADESLLPAYAGDVDFSYPRSANSLTSWMVISMTADPTLTTKEVKGWVNNSLFDTPVSDSDNTDQNFNAISTTLFVGSRNSSTLYLDGDMMGLALYSVALSDANRQAAQNWMAYESNITLS